MQKLLSPILPVFAILLLLSCSPPSASQAQEVNVPAELTLAFEGPEELQSAFRWAPDKPALISAHRGGPAPGYPENCIPAFEHTLEIAPAILEMDVSMTQDSVLILMHDNSLDRTTTGTGLVKNKDWNYIQELKLVDHEGTATEFDIPTLEEVLNWGKGKCIMSLDVKRGVSFEKVVEAVEKAEAEAAIMIIVYNYDDARKVFELNPDLLMSVSIRNEEELQRALDTGIPLENMVAFTGTRRKSAEFFDKLHGLGITCIFGTLGNLDKSAEARGDQLYRELLEDGVDIFATDRPEAVARTIYGVNE